MKQIKKLKTGRIRLCLALALLWVPLVHAGMSEPNFDLTEKKLEAENSLVIANEYGVGIPRLNSLGDAKVVEQATGAVALINLNSIYFTPAVQLFSSSDCSERSEAKLLWFSGHTYENLAYGNYAQYSASSYGYGLLGNEVEEKSVFRSEISLAGLASAMSSSNCHFVVVIDGLPPKSAIRFPANVTVIWSDLLGGVAFHIKGSGLLTRAVVEAIRNKTTWKPEDLTAFLRQATKGFVKEYSDSGDILNGRPVPQPWVQSFSLETTIKFPDAKTSRPKAIRVQEFPTVERRIIEGL